MWIHTYNPSWGQKIMNSSLLLAIKQVQDFLELRGEGSGREGRRKEKKEERQAKNHNEIISPKSHKWKTGKWKYTQKVKDEHRRQYRANWIHTLLAGVKATRIAMMESSVEIVWVSFPAAMIKCSGKSNLGTHGLIFVHGSRIQSIMVGRVSYKKLR